MKARVVRARVPGSEEEVPAVRHNSALVLKDVGSTTFKAARLVITRAVNAVVVDSSGPSSYDKSDTI